MRPPHFPIDHLRAARRKKTARTEAKRRMTEEERLAVATVMVLSVKVRTINQGTPSPKRMSKMLEPTALETAMSPLPCRATMMDEMRSGMEVPAARTVRAMMTAGMCKLSAITMADSTSA